MIMAANPIVDGVSQVSFQAKCYTISVTYLLEVVIFM